MYQCWASHDIYDTNIALLLDTITSQARFFTPYQSPRNGIMNSSTEQVQLKSQI